MSAVLVLARSMVCSSTDLLHLLEYRLRFLGVDLSAVSVALPWQSMALGEGHGVPDRLLPFQKRVSLVSDLPSSVVLLEATRTLLVLVHRTSREVVLWILIFHCLSWFL